MKSLDINRSYYNNDTTRIVSPKDVQSTSSGLIIGGEVEVIPKIKINIQEEKLNEVNSEEDNESIVSSNSSSNRNEPYSKRQEH
jgi:hypothetical protein